MLRVREIFQRMEFNGIPNGMNQMIRRTYASSPMA